MARLGLSLVTFKSSMKSGRCFRTLIATSEPYSVWSWFKTRPRVFKVHYKRKISMEKISWLTSLNMVSKLGYLFRHRRLPLLVMETIGQSDCAESQSFEWAHQNLALAFQNTTTKVMSWTRNEKLADSMCQFLAVRLQAERTSMGCLKSRVDP